MANRPAPVIPTLPVITIVPSNTFTGPKFYVTFVSHTLPVEIKPGTLQAGSDTIIAVANLSLINVRELIMAQLSSLTNFAYTVKAPLAGFIDEIRTSALNRLISNSVVRQAIFTGAGIAVAAYAVCNDAMTGYEVILHVQTFDGTLVMSEMRSVNASSQVSFNGELVFLDGLILTGSQPA